MTYVSFKPEQKGENWQPSNEPNLNYLFLYLYYFFQNIAN